MRRHKHKAAVCSRTYALSSALLEVFLRLPADVFIATHFPSRGAGRNPGIAIGNRQYAVPSRPSYRVSPGHRDFSRLRCFDYQLTNQNWQHSLRISRISPLLDLSGGDSHDCDFDRRLEVEAILFLIRKEGLRVTSPPSPTVCLSRTAAVAEKRTR